MKINNLTMKKNIQLLLMPLFFFMAADAQTQEGCAEDSCCAEQTNFYAKALGGANFLQNTKVSGTKSTYEPGYIFAGSLGYNWHCGLSFEAEYAFRRNAIKKVHFFGQGSSHHGHLQTSSWMANLLVDLPVSSCAFWNIQPFVGAGIGYDIQQMHSSNSLIVFHQKWHHFSWQTMAGLTYPIFCNTEITLEYKFHQGVPHFYNHAVGIGLVYKFGYLR